MNAGRMQSPISVSRKEGGPQKEKRVYSKVVHGKLKIAGKAAARKEHQPSRLTQYSDLKGTRYSPFLQNVMNQSKPPKVSESALATTARGTRMNATMINEKLARQPVAL